MRCLAISLIVLTAALSASGVPAEENARTFKGHYRWAAIDEAGDVEAVFLPTGEETWEVSFHFEFRGSPHTYIGTAEGSVTDGKLTGEVFNERETRKFGFRGMVKEGKFRGTHFETTGGSRLRTGTLSMNAID